MSSQHQGESEFDLENALREVDRIIAMYICNRQQEAQSECDKNIGKHFYFSVLSCVFKGVNAIVTFEDDAMNEALAEASNTLQTLDPLRKKRSFTSRYLSWSTPNYNTDYTDEQIHAEGAHCVVSALASALTLLSEKTIGGLLRAGLHCKNAFYTLRDCKVISHNRSQYRSEASEEAIKSGVDLGFGLFNLIFSMLPARVLRLLKWVGWPSDRTKAFNQLKKVYSGRSMWSPIAALALLGFNCFVEFYAGLGNPDFKLIDHLLTENASRYPDSAFFRLFDGVFHQLKGKPDEAIALFQESADSSTQWIEWKNLCYWCMVWCYCIKFDWTKALEYTDKLIESCPWSPCVFTYQSAAIMKMLLDETLDCTERQALQEQIKQKVIDAPKLKRPIVGRTLYMEKFVTKRCEIYWQEIKAMENQEINSAGKTVEYNTQDSGIYDDDASTNDTDCANDSGDFFDASKSNVNEDNFNSLTLSDHSDSNDQYNSDEESNYSKVNKLYQQNDPLLIPILDLYLIWNLYLTFECDPTGASNLLKRIENKLFTLRYDDTREKYLYLILMRGIIYKSLGNFKVSADCFSFVLENEKYLHFYKHLAPHASLEFGLLSNETGDNETAIKYIENSINNYSHYLNETQIHIRAHTALNIIREQKHGRRASVSSISSIELYANN